MKHRALSVFSALTLFFLPMTALGSDPILDILKKMDVPVVKQEAQKVLPCPEGWECANLASFVKGDYRAEAKKFPVGHLTVEKAYTRLAVLQHIGGEHGVIINTVKVRQGGKWVPYTQGIRLPEGRTELAVPVAAGATEIVVSFDHGKGAEVSLQLERPAR